MTKKVDLFREICKRHSKEKYREDCPEIKSLKFVRDNLASCEDVDSYNSLSGLIVESINKLSYSDELYAYLYDEVVEDVVNAVNTYQFDHAYTVCKATVEQLRDEVLKVDLKKRLVKGLKKEIKNIKHDLLLNF